MRVGGTPLDPPLSQELGIASYLQKPIASRCLYDEIKRVLDLP